MGTVPSWKNSSRVPHSTGCGVFGFGCCPHPREMSHEGRLSDSLVVSVDSVSLLPLPPTDVSLVLLRATALSPLHLRASFGAGDLCHVTLSRGSWLLCGVVQHAQRSRLSPLGEVTACHGRRWCGGHLEVAQSWVLALPQPLPPRSDPWPPWASVPPSGQRDPRFLPCQCWAFALELGAQIRWR